MKNIINNKKLCYLFVSVVTVMVMLVLVLMVLLSQMSSLDAEMANIDKIKQEINEQITSKEQYEDYIESNQFVIDWAIENGLLNPNEILWTED